MITVTTKNKKNELSIAVAQLNLLVGDVVGNSHRIILEAEKARDQFNADIIIFSELTLTAYPPEDLLLRPSLQNRVEQALTRIKQQVKDIILVIGYPKSVSSDGKFKLYNAAGIFYNGKLIAEYLKQHLPNYKVFDEHRYFRPGNQPCVCAINSIPIGLTICEDIWESGPAKQAVDAGAKLIININASPFHSEKLKQRQQVLQQRVAENKVPIVYVNQVGGQDELVFDGGSMIIDRQSNTRVLMPSFVESLQLVKFSYKNSLCDVLQESDLVTPEQSIEANIYQALVLGVRDYVQKNNFNGVVIGLSGGIDSALTLAIAVDALGASAVEAVMMPSKYTSKMSLEDAELQANTLNVKYHVCPIDSVYHSFIATLSPLFENKPLDTTEENIQARCRGVILMALSNKFGALVLTTGNKSELAVGYATLYGDMAGGFDVLKDVPKTLVYRLANYRNLNTEIIPQRVITRPPSAELAPNQKDVDTLPPYDILDSILELYVEKDMSVNEITAKGYDENTVKKIVRMVDLNEYKRRQAPLGVKITDRGFGRDRRYPITSGWEMGD